MQAIEQKIKTSLGQNQSILKTERWFEIMFVHDDEDQSVEVVESTTLDFNAIIENLRDGNSVFIAPKIKRLPLKALKNGQRHGYINHV
jgi:hypothetical protein